MFPLKNIPRRNCIPILYTKGTHYDVGFDMGRNFAAMIKSFLVISGPLNKEFIPLYNTPLGKDIYNETLEAVNKSFPQYIRELEGVADGAQVEFYKLFLLHMDDITLNAARQRSSTNLPVGCTTICVNQINCEILGHTEDALSECLNHFYIVSAHIISDTPQGKYNVTEEKFTSLCYAGHLPGFTMNYNHHGLIFSINSIGAANLRSGKTPRHFIGRALLSAENFEQAQDILRDVKCGAGNGFAVNMTFLRQEGDRLFYNFEVGPSAMDLNESKLNMLTSSPRENMIHLNQYLRLKHDELPGLMIDSSIDRTETLSRMPAPKSKEDVIKMLGDTSAKRNCVFRESDEYVKTIAVGIFDCLNLQWSLYAHNPQTNEPLLVLPIVLKDCTLNGNKV